MAKSYVYLAIFLISINFTVGCGALEKGTEKVVDQVSETFSAADLNTTRRYNIYISKSGNDSNDGSNPETPLRTLAGANNYLNSIRSYLLTANRNVVVNVAAGTYYGYGQKSKIKYKKNADGSEDFSQPYIEVNPETRWTFSLPNNTTTIQGAGRTETIFSGNGVRGPALWMRISRHKDLGEYESRNLIIKDLKVRYYHTALKINGKNRGENSVNENITIDNVYFYKIGRSYDSIDDMFSRDSAGRYVELNENEHLEPSHGAIYVAHSDNVTIKNSRFVEITNDITYNPSDYSNYGGLHAIYINHSQNVLVLNNYFKDIYARGVVKFRDFSNYGRVISNRFLDRTSLIKDQYCDHSLTICSSYQQSWAECPSYNLEWKGNRYKYDMTNDRWHPTVHIDVDLNTSEVDVYQANKRYCERRMKWWPYQLPVEAVRVHESGNMYEPEMR